MLGVVGDVFEITVGHGLHVNQVNLATGTKAPGNDGLSTRLGRLSSCSPNAIGARCNKKIICPSWDARTILGLSSVMQPCGLCVTSIDYMNFADIIKASVDVGHTLVLV